MDTSIIIHSDDVIQHFGVKGMKWGVRRMYNNHVENLRYKYRKKGYSEEVVENKLKTGAIANRKRTRKRERDVEYNKKYNINPVGLEGR